MKSTSAYMFASAGLTLLSMACGAAAPSQELLSARDAYAKLSKSNTMQDNPEGARDAQQALAAAEEAHRDDAGSERERSAAYVAQRKSELAVAQADEASARQDREKADQAYQAQLEGQLSATRAQLRMQEAASEKAKKDQLGWRKKGEDLVITLSGVLFETNGHDLTADAKKRLDVVIHAVRQNPDRNVTIAGYTDSKGRADYNRSLSQKRADVVKAYLEGQGVAASRIVSEGHGEDDAIATNDTEEGRAENRRVEITLRRAGDLPERLPVKGVDPDPMREGKAK